MPSVCEYEAGDSGSRLQRTAARQRQIARLDSAMVEADALIGEITTLRRPGRAPRVVRSRRGVVRTMHLRGAVIAAEPTGPGA